MSRYIALLRGINVGGNTRIGMAALRESFADLGHTEVRTYLQSGNVFFDSARPAESLAEELEVRIAADLGVSTRVLLRTEDELKHVLATHPFRDREDPAALHVAFLGETPTAVLEKPTGEAAEFAAKGREVYLYCPNGYGRTKLNNAFLERRLGVVATTRNWKTVTALANG
ncbi:DUF1697 domain-containing protein [Actinocorallia populi]|uniref:DUF1697 domain-containing protein n=1 Tax=Actinocorallia populi TaxID=2079200 RepID=UPI000D087717|nr:DUF1697 domain-containing protein [Actinocorallia populi]